MDLSKRIKFLSRSTQETRQLGRKLAQQFKHGGILALQGELGSGKTTLVKGLAEGLGLPPEVITSPTFTLVNEYPLPSHPHLSTLIHIDCYRLPANSSEITELGLWDYWQRPQVLIVIEWPERLKKILPPHTYWLSLKQGRHPSHRLIQSFSSPHSKSTD